MYEVLQTLSVEDAKITVYYTIKVLENINIDFLMDINKESKKHISFTAKQIATDIIQKSNNERSYINKSIIEMSEIVDKRVIFSEDIISRAKKMMVTMKRINTPGLNNITSEINKIERIEKVCKHKRLANNLKHIRYKWVRD